MFPPNEGLGIKICGITCAEQAQAIIAAGADALGINLWPQSKRHLPLSEARVWLPEMRHDTTLVAVMVNPSAALLEEVTLCGLFHLLQLHGDEPPELVIALMEQGHTVIKALQVRDESSLDEITRYPCTDILLDAFNPGLYGGVGTPFPWHLATLAAERFPHKRLILSGGLTPENVAEAVQQTHPAAVDVASGVESAPGVKDLAKVRAFIQSARGN